MTKFIATRAAARVALIEKLQELWTARAQGTFAGEKPRPLLFALDGMAASGKSTLAGQLAVTLSAPLIHMDDFFLPAARRSQGSEHIPGVNIDIRRFEEEVLLLLEKGQAFCFQRFDCRLQTLAEERSIPESDLYIIEGSYALHPQLVDHWDLTAFAVVSPEIQWARLKRRCEGDPEWLNDFQECWLPMERAYEKAFSLREKADFLLDLSLPV